MDCKGCYAWDGNCVILDVPYEADCPYKKTPDEYFLAVARSIDLLRLRGREDLLMEYHPERFLEGVK